MVYDKIDIVSVSIGTNDVYNPKENPKNYTTTLIRLYASELSMLYKVIFKLMTSGNLRIRRVVKASDFRIMLVKPVNIYDVYGKCAPDGADLQF